MVKDADIRHYICDKDMVKLDHSRSKTKCPVNCNCYLQFQSMSNLYDVTMAATHTKLRSSLRKDWELQDLRSLKHRYSLRSIQK